MLSKRHALALALLFLAALVPRLAGIGFGLPQRTEDDCMIPYQVDALHSGDADLASERNFNWYPLLLARVAALWPASAPAPPGAPLEQHLAAAARLHVRTRATLAALATLAVPLTWLLARLALPAGWSYLAAGLVATSLLHFSFSQQARPHAPSSALFLAAVLAAVWVRRGRGFAPHLAAGLAAFLAVGCLQSGVLCLVPLGLAYVLRADALRRSRGFGWLLPLAGAALALGTLYPFVWTGDVGTRADQGHVLDLGPHLVFLDQFNGAGFRVLVRTFWSYEPALVVAVLLGLALWLVRAGRVPDRGASSRGIGQRGDLWLALSFALPYALAFGLYERNYERFMIALVPYAAVLAALSARRVARALPGRAGPAVALALLALPTWASWKLARVRAAPDTLQRAAAWVAEHLAPEQRGLLTSKVDLPLGRSVRGLEFPGWGEPLPVSRRFYFLPWSQYLGRLAAARGPGALPEPRFDLAWLPVDVEAYLKDAAGFIANQGADYTVAEVFAEGRGARPGTALTEGLRAAGELLVRFSPDGTDGFSEHPFGYQDETSVPNPHFTWRVLQARCTGPVLEIRRLGRD